MPRNRMILECKVYTQLTVAGYKQRRVLSIDKPNNKVEYCFIVEGLDKEPREMKYSAFVSMLRK